MTAAPFPTSKKLAEAFAYAERLHRHQVRKKNRSPTLSHLMAVAALVLESGGDEEEAIAALLHDGPEDCEGRKTLEEIRQRFGERVADIVEGCTDSLSAVRPGWTERKRRYLELLPRASPSVHLVSLADKVHNVRSLAAQYRHQGEPLWERLQVTREQTLWYYRALYEVYRTAAAPRSAQLLRELEEALTELEGLLAAG